MSALGQKQTFALQKAMSALPPKAEIRGYVWNVSFVSIANSGTGIDPKDIDRIFQVFYTTKPKGMGMGLAICRSLIEAHDAISGHPSALKCGFGRLSIQGLVAGNRMLNTDP